MKINVNALTEKGVLKPNVRSQIAAYVNSHRNLFADAVKLEGKNTYVFPIADANGNTIYIAFDVVVTEKDPAKRSTKRATAKTQETIEIEQGLEPTIGKADSFCLFGVPKDVLSTLRALLQSAVPHLMVVQVVVCPVHF